MRFCHQCGNAVDPTKKFCTNCGAALTPEFTGTDATASPQPTQPRQVLPRAISSGIKPVNGLIAVAGLLVIILLIIFIGYPLLTGHGISASTGTHANTVLTPAIPAGSEGAQGQAYVIVKTEQSTPLPTTAPLIVATKRVLTMLITPSQTTVQITKTITCPSDKFACNNSCVDLQMDNNNCGSCNNSCPAGKYCLDRNCVVTSSTELTSCPDGGFNLLTDPRHCSSCDNSCPNGLICFMGRCDSPTTPIPQ
ncbi:MAG: zinc-ribbon domain-containing protein [Methanoregula sp.]